MIVVTEPFAFRPCLVWQALPVPPSARLLIPPNASPLRLPLSRTTPPQRTRLHPRPPRPSPPSTLRSCVLVKEHFAYTRHGTHRRCSGRACTRQAANRLGAASRGDHQIAYWVITVLFAAISGAVVGLLLNLPIFEAQTGDEATLNDDRDTFDPIAEVRASRSGFW